MSGPATPKTFIAIGQKSNSHQLSALSCQPEGEIRLTHPSPATKVATSPGERERCMRGAHLTHLVTTPLPPKRAERGYLRNVFTHPSPLAKDKTELFKSHAGGLSSAKGLPQAIAILSPFGASPGERERCMRGAHLTHLVKNPLPPQMWAERVYLGKGIKGILSSKTPHLPAGRSSGLKLPLLPAGHSSVLITPPHATLARPTMFASQTGAPTPTSVALQPRNPLRGERVCLGKKNPLDEEGNTHPSPAASAATSPGARERWDIEELA